MQMWENTDVRQNSETWFLSKMLFILQMMNNVDVFEVDGEVGDDIWSWWWYCEPSSGPGLIMVIMMMMMVMIMIKGKVLDYDDHTWYLSFFLHGQNFWRIKFTPKNANFLL